MDNRKIFDRRSVKFTINLKEELDESASKEDLFQLAYDVVRKSFTIQANALPAELIQAAEQLIDHRDNSGIQLNFKIKLYGVLKKNGFSNENILLFFQYYSQRSLYGARKIANLIEEKNENISFDYHATNVFVKENKIYFNSVIDQLYIKDPFNSSKHIKDIKGSGEALFHLSKKGFKFLHFLTHEDLSFFVNKRLLNQDKIKECQSALHQAQKNNDLNMFIFNLWLFYYYISQSLYKIYPGITKEKISEKIKKMPINNPAMLFAAKKTLESADEKHHSLTSFFDQLFDLNEIDNHEVFRAQKKTLNLNNIHKKLPKYLSLYTPVEHHLDKIEDFCVTPKEIHKFKRDLYYYQIEHAAEVYEAQIELKKKLNNKFFFNKEKLLSESNKINYYFLKNIHDIILSTNWKVGLLSGRKIQDTNGKTYIIPHHMFIILKVIQEAKKKDASGKKDIWMDTFNKVAKLGCHAALRTRFFNTRDRATQKFYENFLNAFTMREKYRIKLIK